MVFNGRYSAVCTAKRMENWNHGKGDCFRACSVPEFKRGMSSSSGSAVMVIREGRDAVSGTMSLQSYKGTVALNTPIRLTLRR